MMRLLVNGREDARIDPADRGLQYGDGLFETIAIRSGRARFLDSHFERLAAGARRLGLPLPERATLSAEIAGACPEPEGVVKIVITRGSGPRGYRPPVSVTPTRIVTGLRWPERPESAWTEGVRLRWCRTRLGRNAALAGIKHLNRLEQVLARAEWDDEEVAEGLMMDDRDRAIGGTQTNLFAILAGRLATPALDQCGVAGVMRRTFREWAAEQGEPVEEREIAASEIASAGGLILTNALIGAWPVRELEGRILPPDPRVARFNAWLERQ